MYILKYHKKNNRVTYTCKCYIENASHKSFISLNEYIKYSSMRQQLHDNILRLISSEKKLNMSIFFACVREAILCWGQEFTVDIKRNMNQLVTMFNRGSIFRFMHISFQNYSVKFVHFQNPIESCNSDWKILYILY